MLAQVNSSNSDSGSDSTGNNKYSLKTTKEQDKVTVSCDGHNHVTKREGGQYTKCEGKGGVTCVSGWKGNGSSTSSTSSCPGGSECPNRN